MDFRGIPGGARKNGGEFQGVVKNEIEFKGGISENGNPQQGGYEKLLEKPIRIEKENRKLRNKSRKGNSQQHIISETLTPLKILCFFFLFQTLNQCYSIFSNAQMQI